MWSGSTCRSARDHAVAKTYTECTVTRFSGRISVTFSKTPSSPMPEHTAAAVDPAKNATLVLMVPTVPILPTVVRWPQLGDSEPHCMTTPTHMSVSLQ